MFATLLGPLPRPPSAGKAELGSLVATALEAQAAAGFEPLTDGGYLGGDPIAAWRVAAEPHRPGRQVAHRRAVQPRSSARRLRDRAGRGDARPCAALLNVVVRGLADAGCPLVEVHEPAATEVGTDPGYVPSSSPRSSASSRGVTGTHLSLAIIGGNADAAGIETILAAPYASLAVDLVGGPDNWRLVRQTPGDRGIVCGALPAEAGTYDGPETLLWRRPMPRRAWAAVPTGSGSPRPRRWRTCRGGGCF